MQNFIKYRKCSLTLLTIHFTAISFGQFTSEFKNDLTEIDQSFNNKTFKKAFFAVEATVSLLPKAKITTLEGNYKLQSHLQSAYDLGINYLRYINEKWNLSTGFHFIVGKRNFF